MIKVKGTLPYHPYQIYPVLTITTKEIEKDKDCEHKYTGRKTAKQPERNLHELTEMEI